MATYTTTHVQELERMVMAPDENTIVNQLHHLLLVDDDEIYEDDGDDEEEQYQHEESTSSKSDSISSAFSHIQYVDSIRKNRPLPKIPDRTSSKESPSGMIATSNESLRTRPIPSAKELFHMMDQRNIQQLYEEEDDEFDASDDDIEYGGVYALKTQVATVRLSNKEFRKRYNNELNQHYNTMPPVEEVDEEQFVEPTPNYTLKQITRPVSQISLQAPSLASDRSSPTSSRHSGQFVDLDFDSKTENEQPNKPDAIYGVNSVYTTSNNGHSYAAPQSLSENSSEDNQGTSNHVDAVSNRLSLYDDVQRLAQLNQASMTPEIPNSSIPSAPTHQHQTEQSSQQVHHSQQKNQALASMGPYYDIPDPKMSTASASLIHDKESMKTYRRMASKTKDRNIQFTYAQYLMQLVALDARSTDPSVVDIRNRLQEEAEFWVDKLAKSNYSAALYTKGQWHRHCCDVKAMGIFVGAQYKKVNHKNAFKCFKKAAKHGSVEAHYELAECWMVERNYEKTMEFYKYAASKEHVLSLYKLANILLRGLLDQPKDIRQGLVYLRQAADSEEADCARSAYDLGCILSNDLKSLALENESSITRHLTPDIKLAAKYFEKAGNFGLINATFRLGQIYKQGQHNGRPNPREAYQCFARAAEHNNDSAMIELAYFYKDGIPGYLHPQPLLAFQWCHKATEYGNSVADFILGTFYENGTGVYPDHAAAQIWFERSASKGYDPAEQKLRIHQRDSGAHQSSKHHQKPHEEHTNKAEPTKYYEESVRLAEKTRQTDAEKNCQIM